MNKNLEVLEVLEKEESEINSEESEINPEDEFETIEIEKPKRVYKRKPKDPNEPKKERTAAQIAAWEKAIAAREVKRNERAKEKEFLNEVVEEQKKIAKKKVEDKVVKKAISIKKKQIKKEAVLDEISDDETSYEEVKKIATKPRKRSESNYSAPVFNRNPKDLILFL